MLSSSLIKPKILLVLLFILCGKVSSAQPDSVFVHYFFITKCQIILCEDGHYFKERYSFFKYMYGFISREELTENEFYKLKRKRGRAKRYECYSICDPRVNRIRNEGAMAVTFNEVYNTANDKLGENNWFTKNHCFHWLLHDNIYEPNCYTEFKKIQAVYKTRWLQQIDSVKLVTSAR